MKARPPEAKIRQAVINRILDTTPSRRRFCASDVTVVRMHGDTFMLRRDIWQKTNYWLRRKKTFYLVASETLQPVPECLCCVRHARNLSIKIRLACWDGGASISSFAKRVDGTYGKLTRTLPEGSWPLFTTIPLARHLSSRVCPPRRQQLASTPGRSGNVGNVQSRCMHGHASSWEALSPKIGGGAERAKRQHCPLKYQTEPVNEAMINVMKTVNIGEK
jgi:hypothetical protein